MALHRPSRALEVPDASLVMTATSAIAALIALLVLLTPQQRRFSEARERAERLRVEVDRLAQQRTALAQRLDEVGVALRETRRLEERRRELEARNRELKHRAAARAGAAAALILTFSSAECQSEKIEFYAEGENAQLADGGDWPPVRRIAQPVPRGVVEYRDRAGASGTEATLLSEAIIGLAGLTAPFDGRLAAAARRRAQKQAMWLIGDVAPKSRFGAYAKVEGLRSACEARIGILVVERPEASAGRGASAYRWNHVLPPTAGRRVIHLGHLVWSGNALETIDATREEQLELEARLEKR
jgi:hypothetical protein